MGELRLPFGPGRRGEALRVTLGAAVATVVGCWPTVSGLATDVRGDLGDPLYFAWQLAWVSHATRSGTSVWTTNVYSQTPDTLAYTDTVFGYLPLGWLVDLITGGGQTGALVQLNLALLLATFTAVVSGYLLARVLGARPWGSWVAGLAAGFAPWRDTHVIHINVLSTGGIAFSLALLALGHGWSLRHGWRPAQMRWRWVLAGWVVAAYQLLFGFALGIWFAYTLAIVVGAWVIGWAVRGRRRLPRLPRGIVLAELGGALLFGLTAVLLLLPHLRVLTDTPAAARTQAMLDVFSPPWYGLLTAGDSNLIWGWTQDSWRRAIHGRWPPEMFMSPGLVLIVLALAGVGVSAWTLRRRLGLALVTAALAVLALGTAGPAGGRFTYLPLYHVLPGWHEIRTPGRLTIWATWGLALLAAGVVDHLVELVRDRQGRLGRAGAAVLLVPLVAVYAEGLDVVPSWEVAREPVPLAGLAQPVLVLPSNLVVDYHIMFWSTQGWPVMANGDSSFDAPQQAAMRQEAATFPDALSVAALRGRGVETVVVVRSRTGPGQWENAADAPVDGLGIGRVDTGDAVVFDLSPSGP